MYPSRPTGGRPQIGFGPVPKDLIVLLVVLFATYTLDAFHTFHWVNEYLQLSPAVWRHGFLWQLVTYAFAENFNGIWFLVVAFMVVQFGSQVFFAMGRKAFWRVFLTATAVASVSACVVQIVLDLVGAQRGLMMPSFLMMQGAEMVLIVLVAAFATMFRTATVYLFFILPIQAGWFLWLEILLAFIGFLATKDFASFVGISAAVGTTNLLVSGKGFGRWFKEIKLRFQRRYFEAKLKRMQRQAKGRKKADGGGGGGGGGGGSGDGGNVHQGPWVN